MGDGNPMVHGCIVVVVVMVLGLSACVGDVAFD